MDLILLLLLNIAYFFNIAHSIKCLDWYLYCSNTFTTTELISAHVANNCFFVNSKYSLPISSLIYLIKTFNNISIRVQRFKITIKFALIYVNTCWNIYLLYNSSNTVQQLILCTFPVDWVHFIITIVSKV